MASWRSAFPPGVASAQGEVTPGPPPGDLALPVEVAATDLPARTSFHRGPRGPGPHLPPRRRRVPGGSPRALALPFLHVTHLTPKGPLSHCYDFVSDRGRPGAERQMGRDPCPGQPVNLGSRLTCHLLSTLLQVCSLPRKSCQARLAHRLCTRPVCLAI